MLSVLGQRSGSGWVHEVNFWPHMRQMAFLWTLSCQTSFLFQNQWMGSLVFKLLHFYYKLSVLTAAAEWRKDEEWELFGPLPLRVGHLPLGWQNHVKGCCTKPWMCHLGRTVQLTMLFQHLTASPPLSLSKTPPPVSCPPHVPLTQLPPTVLAAWPSLCHPWQACSPKRALDLGLSFLPQNLFACAPDQWCMETVRWSNLCWVYNSLSILNVITLSGVYAFYWGTMIHLGE